MTQPTSSPRQPLTPEQFRERLRASGITITQWAKDHGYSQNAVYRVLGGQYKGYFGRAHKIAIDLGLKVEGEEPSTPAKPRNAQSRKAA